MWEKDFEYDLILGFWLAIHMENVKLASMMLDMDPSIRHYVTLAVKGKKEPPSKKKNMKP